MIADIRTLEGQEQFVQTDAAINDGSPGGALVNMRGKLIGLPTLRVDPSVARGVGFAIGADTLLAFLGLPADTAQPAPPSPLYRGDPRDLACSTADLGTGWQVVSSDTGRIDQGRFRVAFTPVVPSDALLVCTVRVYANTKVACDDWSLASTPDQAFAAVPLPTVGDTSFSEASATTQAVVVRARAKNVLVAVAIKTSQFQADIHPAVRLLRQMVDRTNAKAS